MSDRHSARLDTINETLESMRNAHGKSVADYIEYKAIYDFELSKYLHEHSDEPETKTDKTDAFRVTTEGAEYWEKYHVAKAKMEGYDRSVKNLDIQRSNIQSQMKAE